MPQGSPLSAIDGLRMLTTHLDRAVEDLLESHDFAFARMDATADQACALFDRPTEGGGWRLAVRQAIDGELGVCLTQTAKDGQTISLSIAAGAARGLAKAVGLAVSFVALSEQLHAGD